MRRHRHRSHKLQSQINVVPYIDVMLVLLIIFMVTAPLVSQSVIELPPAGDIAAKQKQNAIEIQLPKDGSFTIRDYNFDAEETNFATLDDALSLLAERRALFPEAPVLVAADRELPYAQVVAVLARLHADGVGNIGLVTSTGQ